MRECERVGKVMAVCRVPGYGGQLDQHTSNPNPNYSKRIYHLLIGALVAIVVVAVSVVGYRVLNAENVARPSDRASLVLHHRRP